MDTAIIAEPSIERKPVSDEMIVTALWPELACCKPQPGPPPHVGKPLDPPPTPLPRPFMAEGTEYALLTVIAAIRQHQARETAARLWTYCEGAHAETVRWTTLRIAAERAGAFDHADYLLGYEARAFEAECTLHQEWERMQVVAQDTVV